MFYSDTEITLKLLIVDWLKENYPRHRLLVDNIWEGQVGGNAEYYVRGNDITYEVVDIGRVNSQTFNPALYNSPHWNAADPEFFTKLKNHIDNLLYERVKTVCMSAERPRIINLTTYPSFSVSGFMGTSGFSGLSGISGPSGFSGMFPILNLTSVSGFSGVSGFYPVSGYSGISGYSGLI